MIKETTHPRRTYCDYDYWIPRRYVRMVRAVANICGLKVRWMRFDKTRRGWHVVIHWNIALAPAEAVALQFALGSDRRREALNLMRVLSLTRIPSKLKARNWNILFSRKLK